MRIYKYRYCKVSEIGRLKDFIDKHWKHDHILSKSDEMIRFQHHIEGRDDLTFVVAENQETGEFDGVYGYISNWKYAPSHHIPNVQWGAIWKTRDDIKNDEIGKIGLGMLRFILKNDPSDVFGALGISGTHKHLATTLNYTVGDMNRFYIANKNVKSYRIILNPDVESIISVPSDSYVKEIDFPYGISFYNNNNPYKDIEYFENRYLKHPVFKYRYLGLFKKDIMEGIFIFRKVEANGCFILRIMDFIGSLAEIGNINDSVQRLLISENAEYIDCLNYGISPMCFRRIGFNQAEKGSKTILPEYFAPFKQSYVPMEFAYISDSDAPLIIFKADADQDRPNVI